ncbi:hypothetical protein BBF96_06890 [Anoxybacter fermentans]|uniref:Uncharacterized protein n=1 Tax=Anoxybacter fermentans TaxID=1323375 RepID=A0A3S9SXX5_9FIRM|nr:hypothetical protein [Anoxybacter fermentans]AZR73135.1 hypothetical protein BBF96_06890 [Anoxybacter fermentans]
MSSKTRHILAFITTDKELVQFSGKPVLYAKTEEELQKISSELGRILAGNVYRLTNGLVVITEA